MVIEGDGVDRVQTKWERMKRAIKTAAEQTTEETKYRKNEEWFDEECAAYIREENNARQKMLQKETRSN